MSAAMIHEILPVGMLQCNCSIVGDPATREAVVIDPGDEVDRVLAILAKHDLKVGAIISTHAHIDHVGGLAKLHQLTGAPVLMHNDDLELYQGLPIQAGWLGVPVPEMTKVDELLREGDSVRWGRYQARVLHTPGHTRGSVCLYLPSDAAAGPRARQKDRAGESSELSAPQLFAGDTLFAGSIGRTDLWGGSFEEIMRSIRGQLLALPDDTVVYPGHGPATTIGEERQHNPFIREP